MISLSTLTKLYGPFQAVKNLSLSVPPGEVLGLVGPNGAGKTTTLRAIAGIIAPTSGQITINGHDLATSPVQAKSHMAFVPDEPHLFDYLTVTEHLLFTGRLYNVPTAPQQIPQILAELELTDKRDALPTELSRGMKQKLAIACALIHNPSALILDEPLTGLDPGGMRRMKVTIAERARAGAAVLLSSHMLHLVEELCTRILVIRRGEAVAYGTIEQIAAERPHLAGLSMEEMFIALTEDQSPTA